MFIYVVLAVIFLAFLLAGFVLWRDGGRRRLGGSDLKYVSSHWRRLEEKFDNETASAILDADKLLNYVLGKKGLQGSVGEKLKAGKAFFEDLDGVWSAHKFRNKVAHELSEVDKKTAKRALKQFKKALNELGAQL